MLGLCFLGVCVPHQVVGRGGALGHIMAVHLTLFMPVLWGRKFWKGLAGVVATILIYRKQGRFGCMVVSRLCPLQLVALLQSVAIAACTW